MGCGFEMHYITGKMIWIVRWRLTFFNQQSRAAKSSGVFWDFLQILQKLDNEQKMVIVIGVINDRVQAACNSGQLIWQIVLSGQFKLLGWYFLRFCLVQLFNFLILPSFIKFLSN